MQRSAACSVPGDPTPAGERTLSGDRIVRALAHADRLVVTVLVLLVRGYQLLLSPLLGPVCRYAPSCSSYAVRALTEHGSLRGITLTVARVVRCHPWAEGGWDPVPDRVRRLDVHQSTEPARNP